MSENIYFKYYKDVDDKSKETVKKTVQNFNDKINKNKNFLSGFNFFVVNNYKDLKKTSAFTQYVSEHSDDFSIAGGLTVTSLGNNERKEIIINTANTGLSNIWSKNKSESDIAQITMHEIGHQFDELFGSCDKELAEKVKKIPFDNSTTEKESAILTEFFRTKDISDTDEFKKAWKNDALNLAKGSLSNYIFKRLHFEYTPYEIDISDGITDKEVELSDHARSEIFAQLFSYAMGENDGDKDAIISKYMNCYNLVKKYITEFLGITF